MEKVPARKVLRISSLLLLMVAFASIALAQLPTGTILGTVKDATGAIVPGVPLTVTNTGTGLTRMAVSSEDGSYRFPALPVGSYEVRAESPGFQAAVRTGLTLAVGQDAVVNFTLEVGAVTETVEVSEEAPLVNTTSSSLGSLVSESDVADLPLNGRNYVDLTFLQPGISENKNMTHGGTFTGSWFSSNGAPVRSNTYMLDGAVMGNFLGGAASSIANTTLGIEGIREWRVVTNNFSAEYGLTMGSQMAIVTKSGTNEFHGSLFEYLRNSALDARNFFDYKTALTPDRLPPFKRNNFGGSIGGPIVKSKLFFFGTYETLRERLGITSVTNTIPAECHVEPLPADGSCRFDGDRTIAPIIKPILALIPLPNLPGNRVTFPFSQPTTENYGQGRLDWTVSTSDNMFARLTHDTTNQNTTLAFPGFITDRFSKNQYFTVSESHIFSPNLLNTFRFSSSKTRNFLTSPTDFNGPQYELVTGKGLGVYNLTGLGEFGPRPSAPLVQNQTVYALSDDMFSTRGSHSLKYGALINHYEQYNVSGNASTGQAVFPSITHFLRATPSSFTGRAIGSVLDASWHFNTIGLYLQDDWRVTNNFTLNAGLRYEFRTTPVEVLGHGGAIRNILVDAQPTCADTQFCLQADDPGKPFNNNTFKNFSPRVGFAWNVRGDGKTAVRGGAAILYDVPLWSVLSVGFPYSSTVRGTTNFTIPLTFPTGPGARSAGGVDFNLGQPYSFQTNLTIERELPWDTAITASYVGNRGIHLLRRTEGNPIIPQGTPGVDAAGNKACRNAGPVRLNLSAEKCWLGTETRINRNWDTASRIHADSNSFYNALQTQFRKRMTAGLQFQASYTWSKSIDETQGLVDAENLTSHYVASDPFNRRRDRGLSGFDTTHNFSFNTIYRLPNLVSGGAAGAVLNGWWISGIMRLNNGLPFTPALGSNRSRSGVLGNARGLDRPDLLPGVKAKDLTKGVSRGCDFIPAGTPVGTPNLWFDPCAFTIPADGFLGNAGRNILRGPGLKNVDFSMAKDTPLGLLGESGKLEFRAEIFNIFNFANFATPEIGLGDTLSAALVFPGSASEFNSQGQLIPQQRLPSVGRLLKTITPSRQVQFSLKLLF